MTKAELFAALRDAPPDIQIYLQSNNQIDPRVDFTVHAYRDPSHTEGFIVLCKKS